MTYLKVTPGYNWITGFVENQQIKQSYNSQTYRARKAKKLRDEQRKT